MTAAQLAHLAEQAEFAHAFYARTDAPGARIFAQTARLARRLASELSRAEELARIGAGLAEVRAELSARQAAS